MGLNITTKRIDLDGEYEGGWVDITRNIPTNTLLEFIKLAQNNGDTIELLPVIDKFLLCIKAWNFEDNDGNDIPVASKRDLLISNLSLHTWIPKNIRILPITLKICIMTNIIKGTVNSPKVPQTNSSEP